MFGNRTVKNRRPKDEAEKPFWISYSDLMTALMILLLVVMCVALLAVTRTISKHDREAQEREDAKTKLLELLTDNLKRCGDDVKVISERLVIDFGSQATFETNKHQLTHDQSRYLRRCVPEILAIAGGELGKKWIKRIVVEGYADPRGAYLYNLNLSQQRSERVLCVLLEQGIRGEPVLTPEERKQVRDLFLVGGYSYNSSKDSLEKSRRVELRLEFWQLDENREPSSEDTSGVVPDPICPLDAQPSRPNPTAPAFNNPAAPASNNYPSPAPKLPPLTPFFGNQR